jgi:glycosyltransferase involved in cell wall biosynthesis
MGYRFHILGVPHTISIREYSACAFTQKVVKLCKILKARGHTVIHYGHEDSRVDCDEHVTVTKRYDLHKSYGDHNWRTKGFPTYRLDDHVYRTFYAKSIAAIHERKEKGDFLLCPFGSNHKPVADAHSDMIIVEPGIGYPNGGFAKFRVFESYSVMHAYLGQASIAAMNNEMWYDVVIPNYFDLDDFEFSAEKDDYFLFIGRVGPGKGVHVALQIAQAVGGRLVIAGAGSLTGIEIAGDPPVSEFAELVGVVGPEERKRLLARAKAVLAPSMFLEPFCGVQIEAMLSGTPVITTDWGAFPEYNIHGVTGYRCRTFEHFVWAAKNIHAIDSHACRAWAERNFSLDRVGEMYDEYFYSLKNIFDGKGWYEPNPGRSNLDWLNKYSPDGPVGPSKSDLLPRTISDTATLYQPNRARSAIA